MAAHRQWLWLVALLLIQSRAFSGAGFWKIGQFWVGPKQPMVETSFGSGPVKHKTFEGGLAPSNAVELKLGYFKAEPQIENVANLEDKFVLFNYARGDLFGRSVGSAETRTTMTRFAFGSREGYGYDFGSTYLYPYSQTAFQWTQVSTGRPAGLAAADAAILDRYEGALRFGGSMEAGLAFGLADVGSFHVGYEATAIYPRHVFWPWLGSYVLASAGVGAISHFAEKIVDGSPTVGPILYMLLRSGLTYGYYLLVRDRQYWPFRSETPLTTEGLKIGVTFTF